MIRFLMVGACIAAVSFLPASGLAETRLSLLSGVEAWDDDTAPYHGVVMVVYEWTGLPKNARFALEYNTDTLRLEYDGLRLGDSTELGARLTGEAGLTNVLSDYFLDGSNQPDRTLFVSHLSGHTWARFQLSHHWFLVTELGVRAWRFDRRETTNEGFILPRQRFTLEPRAYLTWWRLEGEAGWSDRHRVYPRLSGWATGIDAGIVARDRRSAWGALSEEHFAPTDPRNDPARLETSLRHWSAFGAHLNDRWRLQGRSELALMFGEDDLSRRTFGGLIPYTVDMPGMPWAYLHVDDFGALQTSAWIRIVDDLWAGPLLAAAGVRDFSRDGDRAIAFVWGTGVGMDWRIGPWQVDLRAGYCPTMRAETTDQDAWSALLLLGWSDG